VNFAVRHALPASRKIVHNQWRKRGHFQVQRQRAPLVGLDKKRGKQNGALFTRINVRVLETGRPRARVACGSNAEFRGFGISNRKHREPGFENEQLTAPIPESSPHPS